MASPGGTSDPDVAAGRYAAVEAALHERPQEFEFFQAVRLLERLNPSAAPVGRFVSPAREVVRFSAHIAMAFPASRIQEIQWPADGARSGTPVVAINFLGLAGPSGVLPLYYTELLAARLRQRDSAFASFLDIFNHRMTSLFYRAWEKYRFAIAYERGEYDRFSHHLRDLTGLGTARLDARLFVPDDAILHYSGLLSMHARSAAAMERLLADYFDVPVAVEQFVGSWKRLGGTDVCRFDRGVSISEQLGGGAIVGDEIWHQQSGIRIHVGPLSIREYLDFLPSGTAHEPLRSLAAFIVRGELDFEIRLILKREDVPPCELGAAEGAPRLGWTSWAKTGPLDRDAGDTILRG